MHMTTSTQRLMQVMTTKDTTTIVTPMTMKDIIMRQKATRTTMRGILMMHTITKAIATTLTTNMLTSRA